MRIELSFRKQLGLVAVTLVVALGGCKEPPAATPAPPPQAAQAPAPGARAETKEYVVALAARGGDGTVTITAKPPLHINPEYPTAFRPDPGPVTFDGPKVSLAQESKKPCAEKAEDTCESSSSIKYAGASPGARVSGTVLFSVCEAERCLIEKAQVAAAVP